MGSALPDDSSALDNPFVWARVRSGEDATGLTDGERLFEGKAEALSTSNRLQYLVPNLVEAMFTDFPGNSGETVRISIAPEKKTVRRVD